jgi:hypothetical protein
MGVDPTASRLATACSAVELHLQKIVGGLARLAKC